MVFEDAYRIHVQASDDRTSEQGARGLADDLRVVHGVCSVDRQKSDQSTMDLGAIITVLATSSATVAIARGLADWIRRTRGASLTIERDAKSGSIKAAIENIDRETALRITEVILGVADVPIARSE